VDWTWPTGVRTAGRKTKAVSEESGRGGRS
jgi:hypothetical protein